MPKKISERPDTYFRKNLKPGMHAVGGVNGLFLRASATGAKSFVLRVTIAGRRVDHGLGSYPTVGVAQARELAREAHALLARGINPVEARREVKATLAKNTAKAITFRDVATAVYRVRREEWRSAQHAKNWWDGFERHVFVHIGETPVADVSLEDILRVLSPLWATKTRTGVAIRPRIEAVLGYAIVKGWRTAPNVAAWGSNLEHLLSAPNKVAPTEHFAALPWGRAPEVYKALRDHPHGLATRFAMLTAGRSNEVRGMTWEEVDFKGATWELPKDRTKSGRGHRVPLTAEALAILEQVGKETGRTSGLIWLGPVSRRQLTDLAIRTALRDAAGDTAVTLHGLRSTFRDWARDHRHADDLAEMQLQHTIGNSTVKAYARSDLFEARRELMQAWSDYLAGA